MMLRLIASLLGSAALVIACSGDDSVTSTASSSGGGPNGGSSSSSGASGTSGAVGGSSSSSSSGAVLGPTIDLTGVTAIIAGSDVCGKPAGQCLDAQKVTIDFKNSNVVHTTCVELVDGGTSDAGQSGTQNVDKKRDLTPAEISRIQAALGAVHTTTPAGGFDGQMFVLEVVKDSSDQLYSPGIYCGDKTQYIGIDTAGFDVLWSTLRGLGD